MKIDQLHAIESGIQQTEKAYFKAASDAEESVMKYQMIKYEAEMSYKKRR